MAIQILPDKVVAQIAAGEVIERPASVIKELVENALDAGATSIHIAVEDGGRRLMRVADNGFGIRVDEVELAFARHATSKLRSADDLFSVRTLGFRGEALASIASISHMHITTHHRDEQAGVEMAFEAGIRALRRAVGAPPGTAITVERLFFNTPARLKFMKAESTEKRHIDLVVSRYALAYPHVRFVLEQDGREAFRSSGSGDLGAVLVAALGVDVFRDMLPVNGHDERSTVAVHGFTSGPGTHRADRSRITLFVNGRWIQDAGLSYAVTQAYHTFLTKGRYPIAILMIDVPPEDIDVNVHPTKAEVRFREPNVVFATVQRSVRRAVITQGAAPLIHRPDGENPAIGAAALPQQDALALRFDTPGQFRHQVSAAEEESTAVPFGPEAPARPRSLPMLRVIGQAGASYIVAEGPAGVYLIDQHAAHERILYEQFMEHYARGEQISQLTLPAQTITFPSAEARLVEAHLEALRAAGFDLELFGSGAFVIRSVPAILADSDPVEMLSRVCEELESGAAPGQAPIEERIVRRVCKLAAVKAGTVLSLEQMQGLIRQLERCQSPLTCPHGRPTMIHLSSAQLAREFSRK